MSLKHHRNQMKLFVAITSTAVIGTSFLVPNPVEAAYCNAHNAAYSVEKFMAAGLTYSQALEKTKAKGELPDSDCELEMRGEISYYGPTFPRTKKALGL